MIITPGFPSDGGVTMTSVCMMAGVGVKVGTNVVSGSGAGVTLALYEVGG